MGFPCMYSEQIHLGNCDFFVPSVEFAGRVRSQRIAAWAGLVADTPGSEREVPRIGIAHPELYGQPKVKGIDWARDLEGMRRLKQEVDDSGAKGVHARNNSENPRRCRG